MRYLIIVQDHTQLCSPKLYGKERADNLRKNCTIRLVYPPKDVDETTREISETLGYKTVKTKETSYSYSGGKRTRNVTPKKERRALMLPQEIVDLGTINYKNTSVALKEIVIMEKVKSFILTSQCSNNAKTTRLLKLNKAEKKVEFEFDKK